MRKNFLLWAAMGILPQLLPAATLNLNTGGSGVTWLVKQIDGTNNGPGFNVLTNAVLLTGTLPFAANVPGFEATAWVNPFGGAVWVGQRSTDGQFTNNGSILCGNPCGANPGTYRYTYTFDAPNGGTMILNGFTGDNGVRSLTVTQNNNGIIYSCTAGGLTPCAPTQAQVTASTGNLILSAVANGFVTITADVENLDGPGRNPSGFILAGTAILNDSPAVPEPSTFALLGLGGLALVMRRKK